MARAKTVGMVFRAARIKRMGVIISWLTCLTVFVIKGFAGGVTLAGKTNGGVTAGGVTGGVTGGVGGVTGGVGGAGGITGGVGGLGGVTGGAGGIGGGEGGDGGGGGGGGGGGTGGFSVLPLVVPESAVSTPSPFLALTAKL